MFVTVNAASDHFLQKGCHQQLGHCSERSVDTCRKRAFEITASLQSLCQIIQKRTLPEFVECLCPSPNKRLWNGMSLKFVFRQHYSTTGSMSKVEKNRGRIKWLQERLLLIVVRKHEFCQLKGIQLLNFLPSSLWNYLLLQIGNENRKILRGSIRFSKNTSSTVVSAAGKTRLIGKTKNKNEKTVHFS